MVRVFKETSSTLSEEYVARFSSGNLAVALFRIGKDAGVDLEFDRPKNSFTLSGDWINMVKAHNILEEYFVRELDIENYPSNYSSCAIGSLCKGQDSVVIPTDKTHKLSSQPVPQNSNEMDQTLTYENSTELKNDVDDGVDTVENKPIGIKNDNGSDTDDDDENDHEILTSMDTSVNEVTNDKLKQKIMDAIKVKTEEVTVIDNLEQPCIDIDDSVMDGYSNNDGQDVNSSDIPSSAVINVIDTETDTKIQVNIMDEVNTPKQRMKSQLSDYVGRDSLVDDLIMQCEEVEEEDTGECNSDSAKVDDQGNNKNFKCDQCHFVAKKKKYVELHVARRHYDTKKFSCHLCKKLFAVKKDLSYHIKDTHSSFSTHCEMCDKTFNSLVYFRQHMRIHNENIIFKCDTCSKTFTSNYSLQSHMKYDHLGLNRRPFTCQICGKGFAFEKSFLMHQNSHKGLKPYVCDVCGRAFGYEKCLKEHKYIHDESRKFRCDLCPQRYKVEKSLLNHKAKSHNDTGFICFICGKGFIQKQSLIRHERIHSGYKPYTCAQCSRVFTDNATIRRHMILVHKSDPHDWQRDVISDRKKQGELWQGDLTSEPKKEPDFRRKADRESVG